jgi:hypothetical protein
VLRTVIGAIPTNLNRLIFSPHFYPLPLLARPCPPILKVEILVEGGERIKVRGQNLIFLIFFCAETIKGGHREQSKVNISGGKLFRARSLKNSVI